MTTRAVARGVDVAPIAKQGQVAGSAKFDALMLIPCFWLLGGGYLDGWAHNHIRLETFFTPWHAVLYSGLLAVLAFHFGALVINHRKGYAWQYAMPVGYGLSLLGILGFAMGGVGDMIWHTLFGIELNIDGVFSPTHLALVCCITLIVSGPFRAAWHRSSSGTQSSFLELLPMIISLTFILSSITLISQLAHPFVLLWPEGHQQMP
ncbi:MAG: hypothetical protein M3Z24_13040, partial [Chloroflexota bacterium]|nr:hypothetical protein [Chloroflexota bacterium]